MIADLAEKACQPFDTPAVRGLLKDIKAKTDLVVDEVTTDVLLSGDFDPRRAEETITNTMLCSARVTL